ncbi:MAG: response regulator transcription factor [Patescibacteria group bacterium UBA2103]
MKILIVEDETPLLEALSTKLSGAGHDICIAKDGVEGVTTAFSERPDIVLLDIKMPRKDGLQMLKELREGEWGKEVRVIVLTNLNDPEHIADMLEAGANEYLVKTEWKLNELLDHLVEKVS